MIKFEKTDVWGWEHAIRGMRNPLNSWDKSDSDFANGYADIGKNDAKLMLKLTKAGAPHRKFLRQVFVSVDITAPLYWWKEFDTYKVGTTANSCSTMHKIHAKEFELSDFSTERLYTRADVTDDNYAYCPGSAIKVIIRELNYWREKYLKTKDKNDWWQMIQLLPTSYNQKRTVTMTYENLLNILENRRNHKLDEWREFCSWIATLPYSKLLLDVIEQKEED